MRGDHGGVVGLLRAAGGLVQDKRGKMIDLAESSLIDNVKIFDGAHPALTRVPGAGEQPWRPRGRPWHCTANNRLVG